MQGSGEVVMLGWLPGSVRKGFCLVDGRICLAWSCPMLLGCWVQVAVYHPSSPYQVGALWEAAVSYVQGLGVSYDQQKLHDFWEAVADWPASA